MENSLRQFHQIALIALALSIQAPVIAQQLLILQPDSVCGKDALIHGLASEQTVNYGANPQLVVAAWTYGGIPGDTRVLIDFDLFRIPAGATVNSAFLSLYAWPHTTGSGMHSTLSGSNEAWIERVTSPWDENLVTWLSAPSTTPVSRVTLPASTSPTQDYTIDITTLIQDIVNNPGAQYGLMIKLQTEDYYRRLNFCSSEYSDPAKRPKLEVLFSSPPGPAEMSDTAYCFNNNPPLLLNSEYTGGNIEWSDGTNQPQLSITAPGPYWISVSDCGSVFYDSLFVNDSCVLVPPATIPELLLIMPNTFSPNNDGKNDIFIPVSVSGVADMTTRIYNRWGQVIFMSQSKEIRWDGKIDEADASDGMYFWNTEYRDVDGRTGTLTGHVLLVR